MTIERERLLCDNVNRRSGVFSQGGGGESGWKGGVCCIPVSRWGPGLQLSRTAGVWSDNYGRRTLSPAPGSGAWWRPSSLSSAWRIDLACTGRCLEINLAVLGYLLSTACGVFFSYKLFIGSWSHRMFQVIFVAYFQNKDYLLQFRKKISFDLFMHKHYRAMNAYMVQYKNVCSVYNHFRIMALWNFLVNIF